MRTLCVWNEEYNPVDSLELQRKYALHHARRGGHIGRHIGGLIEASDYVSLCAYDLSYREDCTPDQFYQCRQALAFFQKAEFLDLGIDKEAVAWQKFVEAESLCRETNLIFRSWSRGEFYFPLDVESVFYRAQRKIAKILGEVPELSQLRLRFGPGATTRTKKLNACAREKLQAGVACSEELLPYASCILEELPVLTELLNTRKGVDDNDELASVPVEVTTGVLSFVPKNAKTYRAIVTEPVLNGLLQLGIGDYLTGRLRAFGVDLSDQTRNQRLAREGSLTGALATLDLSSASDTISRELIYHLLPLDWAVFLNMARSRKVRYKTSVINQEKFSSMGNGFTFPLESLVFYALTSACCEDTSNVSVYGDDIICPSDAAPLVMRVLHCAGFKVNTEKSFTEGPFRESCGADYFRGFDIRPYYQKHLVSPASLFVLHNFYWRTAEYEMASVVLSDIHPSLRIFGPDGYGDGHLLGDWKPRPHKRDIGYSGYLFDTFTLRNRRDTRPNQPGDSVLPHYSIYIRDLVPMLGRLEKRSGFTSPFKIYEVPEAQARRGEALSCTLPGSKGYKKISIYTLTPPR